MATYLGESLYGAARALDDSRRESREAAAFESDQAIRDERLNQERELFPRRMRALDLGEKQAEQQLATGKLALETAQRADVEAQERQRKAKMLNLGVSRFLGDLNPQHVADAAAEAFPELSAWKDGQHNFRATRMDNGAILLSHGDNSRILKGGKTPDGRDYSPDDELGMYAWKLSQGLAGIGETAKNEDAITKEGVKQAAISERAFSTEMLRSERARAVAEGRARDAEGKAHDRGVKLGQSFVRDGLKTSSIPGHFANVYSSEDDAKLVPHINADMGERVRGGEEPEVAAKNAIAKVRETFYTSKKKAFEAAQSLNKRKVNWKDKAAMQKAIEDKDQDALALLQAIKEIEATYGKDVARYLVDQVPTGLKK